MFFWGGGGGSKKCSLHLGRSPPFLGFENPLQETSQTRFFGGGVVRLSSTRRGAGGAGVVRASSTHPTRGGGVVDLFGSGSKRRVAKHRKSIKKRKKGLEEKGENTEMHFKK